MHIKVVVRAVGAIIGGLLLGIGAGHLVADHPTPTLSYGQFLVEQRKLSDRGFERIDLVSYPEEPERERPMIEKCRFNTKLVVGRSCPQQR